jgi:hypothetical protein
MTFWTATAGGSLGAAASSGAATAVASMKFSKYHGGEKAYR